LQANEKTTTGKPARPIAKVSREVSRVSGKQEGADVEGKGSKSEGAAALRGAAGVEKVGADALAVEYTEYPKVRIKAGGASGAGGGQRSHESTVSAGMDGSCAICVCMCVCVCVCVCVQV